MLRICVKGSKEQTEQELQNRKCPASLVASTSHYCYYDVEEKYLQTIVNWYIEYPKTLMFFS